MKHNHPESLYSCSATLHHMGKFNSILLIDDDAINNYITEGLLKKLNFSCSITCCKNGKEALDYLKNTSTMNNQYPDLIFLDIHMPIMDGYDFIHAIRRLAPEKQPAIVMLSTSIRKEDEEKLKSSDIRHFIHKPLTEKKLLKLAQQMNNGQSMGSY